MSSLYSVGSGEKPSDEANPPKKDAKDLGSRFITGPSIVMFIGGVALGRLLGGIFR